MDGKLLKPLTKSESVMSMAGVEGLKLKKLIGALRGLWRSSRTAGFDDHITELKGYLRPSPGDPDDADHEQPDDENDEQSVDENDGQPDDVLMVNQMEESQTESEDEGPKSHDEGDDPNDAHSSEGGDPIEDAHSVAPDEDGSMSPEPDAVPAQVAEASSQDSLLAPTLKLGADSESNPPSSPEEVPSSQPESEFQCSQVSSGWLGKAYNMYNRLDKEEKKEKSMQKLLQDIRNDLENEAGATFQDDDMMYKEYEKWCRTSLEDYGDHVYGYLALWSTYNDWVRSQKDGLVSVWWG